MKVKRVLNNNAVVALNTIGEEMILKGKGIAFNKSPGDIIDESKIEETFVSQSSDVNRRYQDVLINIPVDYIEVSDKAISIIKSRIDKKLSDQIYITLTDHISNLLERLSMGIHFDNSLLWDIKRMYKEEYAAGLEVVKLIRSSFDVKVPDDEASFIALHIVNAMMDTDMHQVVEVTAMIEDIYDIVQTHFNLEFDEDSIDYNRFILHLRFFFERVINKKPLGVETNKNMLDMLKKEYQEQFDCVSEIIKYVGTKFDDSLEGEVLYLMIHVVKLTT